MSSTLFLLLCLICLSLTRASLLTRNVDEAVKICGGELPRAIYQVCARPGKRGNLNYFGHIGFPRDVAGIEKPRPVRATPMYLVAERCCQYGCSFNDLRGACS